MSQKQILIIAPHPDDEVLGCGGTIRKYSSEGHDVTVLIVTRGSRKLYRDEQIDNVRREALNAHKLLGVKNTIFLDFPAPELDTIPLMDITTAISKVITENRIETLFLPHRGDIHHDHTIVFNAALVAARPVDNYTVKEIYCYETLSETEWAAPFASDAFIPNSFVNIEDFFAEKQEAMRCFKSQIKDFPNPRSLENIEALSKFRGATVGLKNAEAFLLIRQILC